MIACDDGNADAEGVWSSSITGEGRPGLTRRRPASMSARRGAVSRWPGAPGGRGTGPSGSRSDRSRSPFSTC